jgi:hypothetical protein
MYSSGQVKDLPLMTKEEVSQYILDDVVRLLKRRKNPRRR